MNRRLGIAVLLALLAAWRSQGSSPSVDEPAASESAQQKSSAGSAQKTADVLDVGARLLVRHLGRQEDPAPAQGGEKELTKPQQLAQSLAGEFVAPAILIATLPDPVASHLDWAFDSHLDALRRAFERAGYVLDRFELPWKATDVEARLPGRPGAMLFRRAARPPSQAPGEDGKPPPKPASLWLVYLVGELSTGGIDRVAFQRVLDERAWLLQRHRESAKTTLDERLLIVGPTFSGSSRSLREAIEGQGQCMVVSGAATSPDNRALIAKGADGKWDADVEFASTLHTDATLIDVLVKRIVPQLQLEVQQVVVLKESTTDYGQSSRQKPGGNSKGDQVLTIPFPMSIGSLRRAIVKNNPSDKSADAPSMPGRAARSSVDLDLFAERERAETPLLASKLSPPTVDLLLEEITRTLVQYDVRAALIVASDVRDKLFLGSELKKRLPALQLFTTEGNALYLRPELNRWLRGMVVLSTYPMLLRDGSWRPQSSTDRELIVFANEGAEGTFNAVLAQLGRQDLAVDYGNPIVGDTSDDETSEVPPVWATVVGAGTMLPLAVYDVPRDAASTTPVGLETKVRRPDGKLGVSDRGFLAMLSTTLLAAFLLANVIWRWIDERDRASRNEPETLARQIIDTLPTAQSNWRERQYRIERVSLALHYELYLTFLYASLWCSLLPNVVLMDLRAGLESDSLFPARLLGSIALLVGFGAVIHRAGRAASIAWAFRREAREHFLRTHNWPNTLLWIEWLAEIALRFGVVFVGLGYIAASGLLSAEILRLSDDPTRFALFFHRSIEIDQGVSLLVPLMLIGAVLVAWCYWHLNRIRGLATCPSAEVVLDDAADAPHESAFTSNVRERLFRIVPTLRAFGLFVVVSIAFLWLVAQFSGTLDGLVLRAVSKARVFDWILRLGIVGALTGSVWAGSRLLSVWQAFAATLSDNDVAIASIPFDEVKKDLQVKADLGLWPGGSSRNFRQIAHNAWRKLRDSLTPHDQEGPRTADDSRDVFDEPAAETIARLSGADEHERMEHDDDEARMLKKMVDDLRQRPVAVKEEDKPEWRKAMERVIAIELLLYVEWTVRQMRHLAFFLLLALVLTTLLISSYPYQPQQLIQTVSLLVFAGIIGVLVLLIGAMNRNAALSRMAASAPGELTWDRTLFANLALYGLVPLVTLISSQHAGLRDALFDWLKPLMSFLVKA